MKFETVRGCGADLDIRSLLDRQQYDDTDGLAAAAGISPEAWPLFGVVWPSARVLAGAMVTYALGGQRILEVGCGLGLASLVLHRRAEDVVASDCHPLVPSFLEHNATLNALVMPKYHQAHWSRGAPSLGLFDLIVGSDVLYERAHPGALSSFLAAHLETDGTVLLVDPNRPQRAPFTKAMQRLGYEVTSSAVLSAPGLAEPYRGSWLTCRR